MFKSISKWVLTGVAAFNFGILSPMFPVVYFPLSYIFTEKPELAHLLTLIICALIALTVFWVVSVRQKRQHNNVSPYMLSTFIGYEIGVIIMVFAVIATSLSGEGNITGY